MDDTGVVDNEIIAVLASEVVQWGCPYCGYRSGVSPGNVKDVNIWSCGECGRLSILLAQGLTVSPISVSLGTHSTFPLLSEHPRRGIACHGNHDRRPVEGGEFFVVRGIGVEGRLSCFVCNGQDTGMYLTNIAAFVRTKEAGERVCDMFKIGGCRLDYREYEPDRVQVKIGACSVHESNLRRLAELCVNAGSRIVPGFVFLAINESPRS